MNPSEIRKATAKEAAAFLDAGRQVEQSHLRLALANALERIDRLEKETLGADASEDVLNE